MNAVFYIFSFLKIPLFIFLFTFTGSSVLAEVKPPETVAHYAGKGLTSPILLTEQEQAWLDLRHTVRVRIANSPPYHMTSPEPHGISVDYLKLIGKRFGINFSFIKTGSITRQEAVDDLTGERKWFDLLITMTRTLEREKRIAFTQDYLASPWVIVNRTGSEFIGRMQDLNGKKVAVESGFVIKDLIEKEYPQIRIVPCNTSLDALQSVASGGSDAYIANLTVASYLILKNGLNNLKIAAPTPFGNHDQAMGVRKDWPELASIISKALMAMTEAEKSGINNRWLSIRYDYGVNIKMALIWVTGGTAVFTLVIAVIFIWNRRLRREVNNRILAEEALKKSEALLQSTGKIAKIGGWELDVKSKDLRWTEEVYRIHEVDFDFIPSVQATIDFYVPEARPVISQAMQRAIEHGESCDLELPIITAKGNRRVMHVIGAAQSRDGINITVLGIIQDVTDLKQAEALRQKFAMLADSSSEFIGMCDFDFKLLYVNPAGVRLVGLPDMAAACQVKVQDYFFPEDQRFMTEEFFPRVLREGHGDVEIRLRHFQTGEPIWMFYSLFNVLDASGEIVGWATVSRDITERKQSEEYQRQSRRAALNMMTDAIEARERAEQMSNALRASETTFRAVAELSPLAIYASTVSDKKRVYANAAFYKIFGFLMEDVPTVGHWWIKAFPDEKYRQQVIDQWTYNIEQANKNNTDVEALECVCTCKDGSEKIIAWVGKIIGDEFWAFGYDLTERKKTENEKSRLEAQLRHSQKMEAVGTLAGGIAHDFNNMLNVIMGYSAMVKNTLAADNPSREHMNEVLKAANRAAVLTKRLLIFSRKQVVETKSVNINELILDLQKMLVRLIRENIDFNLDLAARPVIAAIDAGMIEQVLVNLTTNARDAMPEGGRLTISTGLEELDEAYVAAYGYGKPGRYALITVADTGHGIDAKTQGTIFEPFFTTKGIGEGTGLGLAISYGIIKQHNGYIKVYSEPGQGTVFRIYLPLREYAAVPDKQTEAPDATVKGGNETILLAEDDASLRELAGMILESFGYTVILAKDGEDAITKFMENRERISLALIDMIMPKKSGHEVSDAIRKVSPGMKILFQSGYTMDIIKAEELTETGNYFIAKPFLPMGLLQKVREILDK
jgi:PAS domain S-box-containing protein